MSVGSSVGATASVDSGGGVEFEVSAGLTIDTDEPASSSSSNSSRSKNENIMDRYRPDYSESSNSHLRPTTAIRPRLAFHLQSRHRQFRNSRDHRGH